MSYPRTFMATQALIFETVQRRLVTSISGCVISVAQKIASDISLAPPLILQGSKSPTFGFDFRPQSPTTQFWF